MKKNPLKTQGPAAIGRARERSLGRLTLLLLFGICMSLSNPLDSSAQEKEECGTIIPPAQIQFELQRIAEGRPYPVAPEVTLPIHIPLAIHIVRSTAGTGGFTLAELDTAMDHLNQQWSQGGMQFFQHGDVDYINDDNYYLNTNTDAMYDALRQVNPVDDCINVYFVPNTPICGISSFTFSAVQGIIIDSACAGNSSKPSTFAHEVGHYFDLYHTHETAVGVECPDGSNCGSAGDLLCDTPADPDLSGHVSAYPACAYDDYAAPPASCDDTPYAPQTDNLMSYSRHLCRDLFTSDQDDRALVTLFDDRTELFTLTQYVDVTATGFENGTPEHPWNTLAEAVSAADAGDHIFIKSGVYPETMTITKVLCIDKWNEGGGSAIIGQLSSYKK
jgi:hypothetical protein